MIGLHGTKVFVLDDEPSEALPIMQAFARKGIAAAYFDSNLSGLPSERNRLRGVRLAVLDMDLGEGGSSERTMASAVVKRIERIISPENGPYAALLWTNRPTVREEFETLINSATGPKPVVTVLIAKADVKNRHGKFVISKIATRVDEELATVGPLLTLGRWEEACFCAAAGVTNALSALVRSSATDLAGWRGDWKREMLQLVHTLAQAKAEQHLEESTCVSALYTSLTPLHSDRLGKEILKGASVYANESKDIMAAALTSDVVQKAKINSMMHLDLQPSARLDAGNVYFFTKARKPAWAPEPKEILEGFLQGNADELLGQAVPVVAEITAKCDHAQRKIRMARLIGGVAVPASLRGRYINRKAVEREGTALWELGPLSLDGAGMIGEFYLQFNSRFVATLPLKETQKLKAILKLRSQVLSHLQSWFAFQASRPGVVLLRDV